MLFLQLFSKIDLFMLYLDFLLFTLILFSQLLKSHLNKKCDILEKVVKTKSSWFPILMGVTGMEKTSSG
jgi:hypothetical protein